VIFIANLLQEDIKESAKELDWWHRRMRDVQYYAGSASPFDELLNTGVNVLGLECKMLGSGKSEPKSFSYNDLSVDQQKGLSGFCKKENALSYVIVNFRWINHKKGRCFALSIEDFLFAKLQSMLLDKKSALKKDLNQKSIKLDYFKKNAIELERLCKGWDLSVLLDRGN